MNKRRKAKLMPVNFAPTPSPGNTKFYNHRDPNKDKSTTMYKLLFTKQFNNISSTDVKLQKKYGIDLISKATGVNENMLSLKQKYKNQEITHTDRLYYVHKGGLLIGKLSIREQRTFKSTHLIFIFKIRKQTNKRKGY